MAWRGKSWRGEARQGMAGPGQARRGMARQGREVFKVSHGDAWHGRARRGRAWHGKARQGEAGRVNLSGHKPCAGGACGVKLTRYGYTKPR